MDAHLPEVLCQQPRTLQPLLLKPTTMESQERSTTLAELTKALIKVQRSVNGAKPNKSNPHLKNKYADLASVWDTCRELLAENGLAVMHTFKESPSAETVTCVATLLHESGEFMTSSLTMKPGKTTPQEMGSAITYARRYTLAALVGIVVDDDDDANAASRPAKVSSDPLKDKKDLIRQTLKVYKGDDKQDIINECAAMEQQSGWTVKYADAIIAKLTKEPLTA